MTWETPITRFLGVENILCIRATCPVSRVLSVNKGRCWCRRPTEGGQGGSVSAQRRRKRVQCPLAMSVEGPGVEAVKCRGQCCDGGNDCSDSDGDTVLSGDVERRETYL